MSTEILSSAPSILTLYPRAIIGSILPKKSKQLPDDALGMNNVATDRSALHAYNKVCGFNDSDLMPPTWPHILAFPLHMALMTRPAFPFPLLGLVHIRNKITQHRPIKITEKLNIHCRFGALEPHEKGQAFSIITEARVGNELVWDSLSTMLKRGKSGPKQEKSSEAELPVNPTRESWTVPEDIGRRYGKVSGDMNPIHIHAVTARLFGFPKAIAHGMWAKSRILAALAPAIGTQPFSVDVNFKLPVLLPAKVSFLSASKDHQIIFELRDEKGEKPHQRGVVQFL
ncbi:MAG TPA: MaoC/PaaZ C-terminal domain-containing protein [Pseudomonadales bacterium]|nr:MaoC/PaaZ C-terminal domain-containing protein [Pseudomonadales bacterium]